VLTLHTQGPAALTGWPEDGGKARPFRGSPGRKYAA
jgi:hypothetical protein